MFIGNSADVKCDNMKKFLLNLQFIFRPSFWIMNNPYCEVWDKKLNYLLDKYEFENIDWCTAQLGKNLIWISNYPYACFTPYGYGMEDIRASRLTILRAKRKLGEVPKIPNRVIERINQLS